MDKKYTQQELDIFDAKTMSDLLKRTGLDKRKKECKISELFAEIYGQRILDKYCFSEGEMVNFCLIALNRLKYDKTLLMAQCSRLQKELMYYQKQTRLL